MKRVPFTAEEVALVVRRYPHEPTKEVARALGRTVSSVYQLAERIGLRKTEAYLASPHACRLRRGDNVGVAHRFRKGHVPANKGLRRPGWGPGRMKTTQFKRGNRTGIAAQNWCPVGTIRLDSDGYLRIKVRELEPGERPFGFGNSRVWPQLHRHNWEKVHGPVPPGHALAFRDGDRSNCAVENLELISRVELMRRNTVHNLPKPVARAIQMLGALNRKIRERSTRAEEDHDQ